MKKMIFLNSQELLVVGEMNNWRQKYLGDLLEGNGKEVVIVEMVVEVGKREVVEKRWEAEEKRRRVVVERRLEVEGSKLGVVERRSAEVVRKLVLELEVGVRKLFFEVVVRKPVLGLEVGVRKLLLEVMARKLVLVLEVGVRELVVIGHVLVEEMVAW